MDDINEADDDLAPMPLGMRRNTWSFENRWVAKFRQTEATDYGDDHETMSVGSCDSETGFPRRSSLKDLTKLAEAAHNLEHTSGPQLSPGPTRRFNSPGRFTVEVGGSEFKEPSSSGVPNSSILNWLLFKKYVHRNTIEETSESPKDSPVDEDGTDSAITITAGSGPASPLPGPSIHLSGKLLEAAAPFKPNAPLESAPKKPGMRRNFSLNEMGAATQENVGVRRNFSFKDLNAVAPSGW